MKNYTMDEINEFIKLYYEHLNGEKISILAEKYYQSESTIYRKISRGSKIVEMEKEGKHFFEIDLNNLEVMIPNIFVTGVYNLSLNAHKLFVVLLALYQSYGLLELKYKIITNISPQLKNKKRIEKIIEELNNLVINISESENIKIYDYIAYEKSKIKFKFTKEALSYVNVFLNINKLIRERQVSTNEYK